MTTKKNNLIKKNEKIVKPQTHTINSSVKRGECTPKGILKNFVAVTKQTPVPKAITSGNKVLDYVIQSKIAQKAPYVGSLIKSYNYGNTIGASLARGKIAVTQSCFNKNNKKK